MPLNIKNIKIGDIVEADKGKYKLLDFEIINIKEKFVILRFKPTFPEDKDIKIFIEKLSQNYTSRKDYLSNLLTTKY